MVILDIDKTGEEFLYGYSLNLLDNIENIKNWQTSNILNLPIGKYVFFVKLKNKNSYFKRILKITCKSCKIILVNMDFIEYQFCKIQSLPPYIKNYSKKYQTITGVIGLNK